MNQQRKLLIIVGVVLCVVLGVLIVSSFANRGRVTISVAVAPTGAKLTIDGKSARAGKISIAKGKHTLKASLQYFTDDVKQIDTAKLDLTKTVYLSPAPNSEQAKQWLLEHPDQQQQREAQGGRESAQQQQALTDVPVTQYLPFIAPGFEFEVDYDSETGTDGQPQVTIIIKADSDQAKQDARDWIRTTGTDLSKITITYQPLDNTPDNPNVGHQ